jgi:hypothetical protein
MLKFRGILFAIARIEVSMIMRLFWCIVFLGALRATTFAAPATSPAVSKGATGTWRFTIAIRDLQILGTAVFVQSGNSLKGDIATGAANSASAIAEGMIKGGSIKFKVDSQKEAGIFETIYSGQLKGDTILGTIDMGWSDHPEQPHDIVKWIATRIRKGQPASASLPAAELKSDPNVTAANPKPVLSAAESKKLEELVKNPQAALTIEIMPEA